MIRALSYINTKTLALLFVGSYFLYFSWPSLNTQFTPDDLMNCYFAWLRPFESLLADNLVFFRPTPVYRPLGALLYKLSFSAFGFELFPLRLLVLFVLAANVYLTYAVARQLTGSFETGILAALFRAYHGNASHLLFNTGHIYEVFCYFFYFSALLFYLRIRATRASLSMVNLGVFASLLILALDSKEMAVSLPLVIGVYELLYCRPDTLHPRDLLKWVLRQGRAPLIGGVIVLFYIWGRVLGPGMLAQHEAYQVRLSLEQYINNTASYINLLFYSRWFRTTEAALLVFGLFAATLVWRCRALVFFEAMFVIGLLPVAFISPRSLEQVTIPTTGLMISGAMVILAAPDLALRALRWRALRAEGIVRVGRVVCVAAIGLLLLRVHPASNSYYEACEREWCSNIRGLRQQLIATYPAMPRGSRLLFVDDPFGPVNSDPVFIGRLLYRDETLVADRLKVMNPKPDAAAIAWYDHVLSYKDGRLTEFDKGAWPRKQ